MKKSGGLKNCSADALRTKPHEAKAAPPGAGRRGAPKTQKMPTMGPGRK